MHATFCQLCGLPTQHDHYVAAHGGGFNIYRGSMENGGHDWAAQPNQPFPFTPSHAWLRDAVGLLRDEERVVRGTVEDGGLVDPKTEDEIFVSDGDEDALVFHHWCWELMGCPVNPEHAARGTSQLGWAQLAPYQEQLFEFADYAREGKGELLNDPRTSTASRERITAALEDARRAPPSFDEPNAVDEVLKLDRDWRGTTMGNRAYLIRYREGLTEEMVASSGREHLLCLIQPATEPSRELEALERQFKQTLEADGLGVTVLHSFGEKKLQLLAYVRDLKEAHRRVEALGWNGPLEFDDAHDPAWKIFFHDMGVPRR
ncbi:MAG: hypothetical protein QM817_01880 [Archangium sp.]